jgi:hypothetical protein
MKSARQKSEHVIIVLWRHPEVFVHASPLVDPADGFHRQHGAKPGPSVQRFKTGSLRADEHAPADQAAMPVVEGIEHRLGRGATSKTVPTPLPPGTLCCVEHQQVIGAALQDLAGDCLLAAHGIQRHDAVRQR